MTGFEITLVAFMAMLIDHIGFLGEQSGYLPRLFLSCRFIGKLAMPLFIFLVTEGYSKATSRSNYLRNLFFFALLSEIPFDMFYINSGIPLKYHWPKCFDFSCQNAMLSLAFGALAIYLFDRVWISKLKYTAFIPVLLCMSAAFILKSEYGPVTILAIVLVHLAKDKKQVLITIIITAFLLQFGQLSFTVVGITNLVFTALPAIIIWYYNGVQKLRFNKWIFYWTYPMHLAVLSFVWLVFGVRLYIY